MPCLQGANWCITIHTVLDDESQREKPSRIEYMAWQLEETPTTKKPHVQMYIQTGYRGTTLKMIKELFKVELHAEVQKGTNSQANSYVFKDETRIAGPWSLGEFIMKGSNSRSKRKQCELSPERMADEEPDLFWRVKATEYEKIFKKKKFDLVLKPWQVRLEEQLSKDPDERTIIWVYGPDGGEGKSTYAKLLSQRDFSVIKPSSIENMMYLYHTGDANKNLVLDIPKRVNPDHADAIYDFIESVKDRFIQATKYRSVKYHLADNVHVIVMSNFNPDMTKLSAGRVYKISVPRPELDGRL